MRPREVWFGAITVAIILWDEFIDPTLIEGVETYILLMLIYMAALLQDIKFELEDQDE